MVRSFRTYLFREQDLELGDQGSCYPGYGLGPWEEILIDLSRLDVYTSDEYARIYNIPPELTNNREIMSVINVSYVPFGQVVGHRGGANTAMVPMMTNDLTTAATQVMNSVSAILT